MKPEIKAEAPVFDTKSPRTFGTSPRFMSHAPLMRAFTFGSRRFGGTRRRKTKMATPHTPPAHVCFKPQRIKDFDGSKLQHSRSSV
jgi:hypothetical protein